MPLRKDLLLAVPMSFALGWALRPRIANEGSSNPPQANTAAASVSTADAGGQALEKTTSRSLAEAVTLAGLSQEEVTAQVLRVLAEKDWMKRSNAFNSLLLGADRNSMGKISLALTECYKRGLPTGELGEVAGMREGMLLGAEGMNALPKEPNGTPSYLMKHRMRGWASQDPVAGQAWLAALEAGRTKDQLQEEWKAGLKNADGEKLLTLLPSLPVEQQEGLISRIVGTAVQERGLTGMTEWFRAAESTLPDAAKDRAFRVVIDSFTQSAQDWPQAVDFIKQTSRVDQPLFAAGLQQMVWRSARYDPQQTLSLLDEYAPQNEFLSEERGNYIRQCLEGASTNSINSIGEWLSANKQSQIYNDVAIQFIAQVRDIDPVGARAWTESIADPVLKAQVLSELPPLEGPPADQR